MKKEEKEEMKKEKEEEMKKEEKMGLPFKRDMEEEG